MLQSDRDPPDASPSLVVAPSAERYVRPKQSALIRFGKRMLEPDVLPQLAVAPAEWAAIRGEAKLLLAQRAEIPPFGKISPDHRRIASGPHWKSFFFTGYGFRSEENLARCPATARFLERVPGVVVAFYSIMEGDTYVPRHRGLTKAWLNCHLPLIVPDAPGRCEIAVGGRMYRWQEGRWFVFDETFAHEVWNDTGQPRVVLMLQLRRPMRTMGTLVAKLIHAVIRRTGFVQDVRKALGAR